MSDDDDGGFCALCCCVIAWAIIAGIFMTVASPIFLLYGFFSGEWLIEDLPDIRTQTTTGSTIMSEWMINTRRWTTAYYTTTVGTENKIYYGLYKKCHKNICSDYVIDETTFGLEVTSVVFQFLAILALPWLKPCVKKNKWLKYWNYCFVPFLLIAAGFSLFASLYFNNKYSDRKTNWTTGASQTCAGLGGGFQIVLTIIIAIFFYRHGLLCCKEQSRAPAPTAEHRSLATTGFVKTESIFMTLFSYDWHSEDGSTDTVQQAHIRSNTTVAVY